VVVYDELTAVESKTICIRTDYGLDVINPAGIVTKLNCGCSSGLPRPSSFSTIGSFYTGYTEPYSTPISYSTNPIQDSVCQAQTPIAASTIYSFDDLYVETGYITPIVGMQLYSDSTGTLSTFTGILIFTYTTDVLPTDITSSLILYVLNGVIMGVTPATNFTNC
jgi:hypothetical protein